MVGPISSHTAGACRLGYFAQKIHGHPFHKVRIELHGSFAEVAEGHGTDTALVGGLLGLLPSDARLPEAFSLAQKAGLEVSFYTKNLGADRHPNTVRFSFEEEYFPRVITGSSVGGGRAEIIEIDKIPVHIGGAYSCLLIKYEVQSGLLNRLLAELARANTTIVRTETMDYKDKSLILLDIRESRFSEETQKMIEAIPGVFWVRFVPHISHYSE